MTSEPRVNAKDTVCFLAVGDMHAGLLPEDRLTGIFAQAAKHAGVNFMTSPGDLANAGLPDEHDLILPFITTLPFPFLPVMGNHDTHTPEHGGWDIFCLKYALQAPNYVRRIGPATFVFLSPDQDCDGLTVDIQDSMPFLRAALADGDGPVVVFCHPPITDTVGGAPGRACFLSTDEAFFLPSSSEVRALFAEAKRPALWISGHTHSPLKSERLISTEWPAGPTGAPLHHVNVGSPYFTGRDMNTVEAPLLYRFEIACPAGHGAVDVTIEGIPTREMVRKERLAI